MEATESDKSDKVILTKYSSVRLVGLKHHTFNMER